jgi:hypothetical protein
MFVALAIGKPIAVSGPLKPLTWQAKNLKARATAFLRARK